MPVILDPSASPTGLLTIGPLAMDSLIEPTTVQFVGPPNARGGVPVKIATTFVARTGVEQLEALVNNPLRRQSIAAAAGVLEWVTTSPPLEHWQGWWLLDSVEIDYSRRQFLLSNGTSGYVPITITGTFFGQALLPAISATHRTKTNDFSLTGTTLNPSLFPSVRDDASSSTEFTRQGNGQTIGMYLDSANVRNLRMDASSLVATYADARPALSDGSALWYGPRVQGVVTIQSALFQATLNADGTLAMSVRTPAAPTVWTSLGNVSVYQSSVTASEVAGAYALDDRVQLTIIDSLGRTYTITVRHGDYGCRILSSGFSRTIQTEAVLSAISGNYYLESSAGPGGGKRFIALVNAATSSVPASGQVTIGADQEAFFGYEPASAATNDTAANQGKQFLADRSASLTIR